MNRQTYYRYEHDTETGCLHIQYWNEQVKEKLSFSVKPSMEGYLLLVYRSEKEEVTQRKREKWREFRMLFAEEVQMCYKRERLKCLFN